MRSFVVLCLTLAVSVSIANAFTCEVVSIGEDETYYSFCSLFNTPNNYNFYVSDTTPNASLQFSLGNFSSSCSGNTTTYLGKCQQSADHSSTCSNSNYTDPVVSYIDSEDPTAGLVLTYDATATGYKWSFVANLYCNSDSPLATKFDNATYSNKTVTFNVQSSNSCPNVTLSKLVYYVTKYQGVFIALAVILGLFICFFGLPMLKYTIFIIAALAGTFVSASLFVSLIGYNAHAATFWLIFAVCVVIGCVLGWVAVKVETLGFVVLGAVLGVVGGDLLFTAVLAPIGAKVAIYWVSIIVCAIIGAGVAYKFWKSFVIIATGLLGSFMVVKSVGGLIGGFPSADSLSRGIGFTPAVYGYIAAIAVLAVAGMYVQHKRKKASEVEEESDVHGYQRVMAGYNA